HLRSPLSRDLETICLKCLEKEPGNRYPGAEALADELRRFLDGEPIQARPVAVWQRLWRSARRRPPLVARVLGAAALWCVLLGCGGFFWVTDQLTRQAAEGKYQKFVQSRNGALFYGLPAPDQGALFLGAAATANLRAAESAAREALALAGVEPDAAGDPLAGRLAVDPAFPAQRGAEITADCYPFLLVLSSAGGQQPLPDPGGKERYQEALRLLDGARKLGFETRAYHLRRAHFLEQLGEHGEAGKDRDRARSLPLEGALDHFLIGEEL